MKKTLIVAAVLSTIAGAAAAQSSVTLFGVIDMNARYIKNGDASEKQLGTDGANSSRLGFRGVEDLGGGLKGSFWLESGLNPDTGTQNASGKFWHRRSTVSLEHVSAGELRLGRDYTPQYTLLLDNDPFGDNGVGQITRLLSNLNSTAISTTNGVVNTNTRADNQVTYLTPKNLGGFYARVAGAPGERVLGNSFFGGRVGWAGNGLDVSGSYAETKVNSSERKYKIGSIGASYDFKVVRLMATATQAKLDAAKENLWSVGATVPVGPSGVIRASYTKADLKGGTTFVNTAALAATGVTQTGSGDDADMVALGYLHNVSKRTALYGTAAYIKNKGNQRFTVGTTGAPFVVSGEKSTGVELGVRHSF